jgi:hypothetical protein
MHAGPRYVDALGTPIIHSLTSLVQRRADEAYGERVPELRIFFGDILLGVETGVY